MGDPAELNATYPVRPTRGVNRGYQTGQLRADGTLATYTAVCAPTVYRGDRCRRSSPATCSSRSRPAISSAASSISDDGTHAARAKGLRQRGVPRLDRRAVPPRQPVLGARTARCTSSTCTTASSSTRATSPSICAITSSRASSRAPIRMGRIWRIVHDTTRRDARPRAVVRVGGAAGRPALATRMAGGATRRSSCWCSAATSRSFPR